MRPTVLGLACVLLACLGLAYVFLIGSRDPAVPTVEPAEGMAFAYVDVAAAMGYTLRNRSGKDGQKNYILEAMPPGVAVGDFDGDGWMDLYCPNGNNILRYNPATGQATMIPLADAPRNALYFNLEGKRFEDRARASGTDDHLWSFGAVAGDIDNDGDTDIYVCNWGVNRLYLNRGDGTFEEVAGPTGAAGSSRDWSAGACFVDHDGDGDLDIYVAQYADVYDMLQRPDITKLGPKGEVDGRNCDWKKLRVYCGPVGLQPVNDVLLRNQLEETGKLRFADVTREAGLWTEVTAASATEGSSGPFYGFQPVAWDIDGDGRQDILVANDSQRNSCWMNLGNGRFEDRADLMGLSVGLSEFLAQASMGVAVGDINRDGLFDVIMTEFSHDQFNLLLAERLKGGQVVFSEKAAKTGMRAMTFRELGWGAILFDPDLDRDLDLFFACGHVYPEVDNFKGQETTYRQYNLLILNLDPGRPKLESVGGRGGPGLDVRKCSRAAVVIDFDNDGDPDIATSEMNDRPTLLRCDVDRSSAPRHWLSVRLRGDPAHKVPEDPAGAVVTVAAGGVRQSRVFLIGSSFQSSEDPRLLFGLGDAGRADSVDVLWPNGETSRLEDVAADRAIEIRYGD